VLPVDWKRFLSWSAQGATPPFFAEVAGAAAMVVPAAGATPLKSQHVDLQRQLADAPQSRRRPLVAAFIRERALRALGVDPAKPIDPRTPLGDLGLDSLLAVELRNTLGGALSVSLPATLLFDYPSIEALTDYLLADVLHLDHEAQAATTESAAEAPAAAALVGSIEAMSDEEVDRLIAARAQRKA
jgi:myxalamid-type polyketide synthase MxaC